MPFCPNCGAQYDAGARFCEDCGTPFVSTKVEPVSAPVNDESKYAPPSYGASQPQPAAQPVAQPQSAPSYNAQPQYQEQPQQSTDALCIAGFICSLLLSGLLGLILSIAGINRAKKSGAPGKGFGVAGIIISIFKLLMILIFAGSILFVGIIAYIDEATYAASKNKKSKYEQPRQAIELIIDDYER
ncbi:MAG: zinc ribbon domain-containing protein [Clostridiales bacterium]|nr:zinc ribbon domain-containing protein [Clostridiales bacterium]